MERVNNPCQDWIEQVVKSATATPLSYDLLHTHGKSYTKNAKIQAAHDRQCFRNAMNYAIQHDLIYVEGYAMPKGLIPLAHAWCVDKEGTIYDPTWDHGVAYFGVPFNIDFIIDKSSEIGYYGIFENLWLWKVSINEVRQTLVENVLT